MYYAKVTHHINKNQVNPYKPMKLLPENYSAGGGTTECCSLNKTLFPKPITKFTWLYRAQKVLTLVLSGKVHGQFLHFQRLDQQGKSGKSGAAIPDWSHCSDPLFYNQDTTT